MTTPLSHDPPPVRRKAGLGRGLDSLFGDARQMAPIPVANEDDNASGDDEAVLKQLPVASISPHPGQPRRHFDEDALTELADSIREHGILQPIVVRRFANGYQIVAGERRWRAAQRAGLTDIPAVIRDIEESQLLELALIENIQRADLSPIEEAEAYQALIRQHSYTATDLARRVDKSRSHVANLMRLLDLPDAVRTMLTSGRISMGQARPLIGLPADSALALAEHIEAEGLTVRDVETYVRNHNARPTKNDAPEPIRVQETKSAKAGWDSDLAAIETQLSNQLGVHVQIRQASRRASGQVTVSFSNFDQLDMIVERLSGITL